MNLKRKIAMVTDGQFMRAVSLVRLARPRELVYLQFCTPDTLRARAAKLLSNPIMLPGFDSEAYREGDLAGAFNWEKSVVKGDLFWSIIYEAIQLQEEEIHEGY